MIVICLLCPSISALTSQTASRASWSSGSWRGVRRGLARRAVSASSQQITKKSLGTVNPIPASFWIVRMANVSVTATMAVGSRIGAK